MEDKKDTTYEAVNFTSGSIQTGKQESDFIFEKKKKIHYQFY